MKTSKNLAIIFTITLVISFVGIMAYLSTNRIAAYDYIGSHNINNRNMNQSFYRSTSIKNPVTDWLDFIPFVSDNVKDHVKDRIQEEIDESLSSVFNDNITYDKKGDTIINNYSTKDVENIRIDTDVAKLTFIQEDRTDIKVEYIYTKPDTNKYIIKYDPKISGNTLDISQNIITRNFFGSMNDSFYKNDLFIYVPEDFTVNQLSIDKSLGDIISSDFYSNATDIDFYSSLGDIDVTLANTKNSVTLKASMGKINLINNASIDKLEVSSNNGSIDIRSSEAIKDIAIDADMGSILLNADDKVNNCRIEANMGSITASFKEKVDSFNITCDMGDIEIDLYDNDDSIIGTDVSMGKLKTDFANASNSKGDYYVECDMGNITLKKR